MCVCVCVCFFFISKTVCSCQSERAHNMNCVMRWLLVFVFKKALISNIFVRLFYFWFYSLRRLPTTTVYNHTECSSISQTREPGTRMVHPGPKKPTILCDQARCTPIAGQCPRKWVPPKMTHSASRGCTIPVLIQWRTRIRVSPYLAGNESRAPEKLSRIEIPTLS